MRTYLIPKNGAPVKGQFIRLEGSLGDADPKPPVIVFKKESGEETRIAVGDMRRLYLGNYTPPSTQSTSTTSGASSAPLSAGERLVTVMANADWVDTGLTRGSCVRGRWSLHASGEITLSADQNDKATPAGSAYGPQGGERAGPHRQRRRPHRARRRRPRPRRERRGGHWRSEDGDDAGGGPAVPAGERRSRRGQLGSVRGADQAGSGRIQLTGGTT